MTQQPIDPQPVAPTTAPHPVLLNRTLLAMGALGCMLLFWAATRVFGIPAAPGYSGSLLQQPSPGVAIIITLLTLVAAVFVGTTFAGRVHRDAGLFCACIGLALLSLRGGPIRYVLFNASGKAVYLMLAGEIVVLGAMLAAMWIGGERLVDRRERDEPSEPGEQNYFTTLVQVLLMIALMSLLAQSDAKGQAMCAVAASALLATLAANWFAPASPSPWLWAGPIIVGAIGYVSCYFRPTGIEIGRTGGYFAALARPLPLDYASVGVAAAMLGYWMSHDWHERARSAPASDDAPPVVSGAVRVVRR
jgi:hypothetical protein